MDDHVASHAMTEIALALAMAFFCLLVLALVSIGGLPVDAEAAAAGGAVGPASPRFTLSAPTDSVRAPSPREIVLIHRGGVFVTPAGARIEPQALPAGRPVVIALEAGAPLSEALAARGRLTGRAVTLTVLPPDWASVPHGRPDAPINSREADR